MTNSMSTKRPTILQALNVGFHVTKAFLAGAGRVYVQITDDGYEQDEFIYQECPNCAAARTEKEN
jgi:hypothetical protein